LPPLTDRFLNWSQRTLALGLPVEDEPLRLLWAMTLGWRTALTADISEPFLRAGTMHLFAIDGLRIALISGMLVALLRVLQISRAWCGLVAIPVIWFYTAATGWESSAIRASVMMTIVIGGWALKRPGDLINSLAAAAVGASAETLRRATGAAGGGAALAGADAPNSRRMRSLTKSEESNPQLGQMNFTGVLTISGVTSKPYLAPQEHCSFMTRE